MKALVTGAAGFIGSHIADRLLAEDHEVIGVDDLSTGVRENLDSRARFCELDLNDPELAALIRNERPDVIFHEAAQVDVRRSVTDPIGDLETNVRGTVAVALAAISAGTPRLVFASSGGAIYGDGVAVPTPEDALADPVSPYGCAKLASEKYLRALARISGLTVVCLRYANVYGPRQALKGEAGVVSIFARKLIAGETPVINGDGLQTRDFVYVKDVVDANMRAMTTPHPGVYNIGTGVETTVVDIYRHLARAAGFEGGAKHGPDLPGEQRRSALSWQLASRELGWKPRKDLAEGLAETIAYFRSRSDRTA